MWGDLIEVFQPVHVSIDINSTQFVFYLIDRFRARGPLWKLVEACAVGTSNVCSPHGACPPPLKC